MGINYEYERRVILVIFVRSSAVNKGLAYLAQSLVRPVWTDPLRSAKADQGETALKN